MTTSGVLVFVILHLCLAEDLKRCVTPSGREGVCRSIHSCPFLKSLATREVISRKEIRYLRRSACGFDNAVPLICCPEYGPKTCSPSAAPPDPWSGCCGVTATSFFRKETYTPAIDQYPWMASIEYDNGNKTGLHCAGALISSRYVLSVATGITHVPERLGVPKRVRLGDFDVSRAGPDCVADDAGGSGARCTDGALSVPIQSVTPHPGYESGPSLNNIGLIRLSKTVPYTDFIRPICLPTMDLTESPPRYLKLYVAGWGATQKAPQSDLLRHVRLPYVDRKTCQLAYEHSLRRFNVTGEHVCAGGEKGRDSCRGDSGAPLMYEAGPFVELLGLVSIGPSRCGLPNVPTVHTKVFSHVQWIRENIRP